MKSPWLKSKSPLNWWRTHTSIRPSRCAAGKKVGLFCLFKPHWQVQSNISGIFEQFSIRLCVKNMKTQETFKKKSGHTPVLCVRKYFLISALGASINDVYKNKGGGGLECIYWWRHCYYVDKGGRGSENWQNLVDVIYGRPLPQNVVRSCVHLVSFGILV